MKHLCEISPDFRVYCICVGCDRQEIVDHLQLVREQGDMTVEYFRSKARCSECGIRTEDIRIVYVGKTSFGYRDHSPGGSKTCLMRASAGLAAIRSS